MEKILTTGSGGYIGGAIDLKLGNTSYRTERLEGRLQHIRPKSLDHDCIVHSGGALRHREKELYESNVLGTERLLEGIANSDCRIVFISSRAVYAPSEKLITEDSPVGPENDPYGESKLQAEKIVAGSGFPYILIRPTNVYGLGSGNMGIGFPIKALQRFINRETVTLHSPDRSHDFLYVQDLAEIVLLAIRNPQLPNIAMNAASDPSSLHDLARKLAACFEKKNKVKTSLDIVEGPPPRNAIMDNSLLKKHFPEFRFTEPETVLYEMVDYALHHASTTSKL